MRIAYLDCSSGISGDMTLAALIDAGVPLDALRTGIDSLQLPGVKLHTETVMRCGFRATYIKIEHPEQHAHRHLGDINRIIEGATALTDTQKILAKSIFLAVAQAEAKVHNSTLDHVHFHEVGAIDSIVDIVGAAMGFDLLGAEQIYCSPLPTGRGQVRIAHGICTVPTPGTAEILKGIPLVDVPVQAELTTPTGAAIVKTLVDHFGPLPDMTIEQIGYGAGTKSFPDRANVLRLFVGTNVPQPDRDQVSILETNLDDISPEIIGHTKQRLLAAGALDVYSIPIQMKKDRPGTLLSVICEPSQRALLEDILFQETATFGIRHYLADRSKRERQEHTVETPFGLVRGKLGWRSNGDTVFTPEFADCVSIATHRQLPLREIYRAAEAAYFAAPVKKPGSLSHSASPPPHRPSPPHAHDHDHDHHDHDHDHDHH